MTVLSDYDRLFGYESRFDACGHDTTKQATLINLTTASILVCHIFVSWIHMYSLYAISYQSHTKQQINPTWKQTALFFKILRSKLSGRY